MNSGLLNSQSHKLNERTVTQHFYFLIHASLSGIPHIPPGGWRLPSGPKTSFYNFSPRVVGIKSNKLLKVICSSITSSLLWTPKICPPVTSSPLIPKGYRLCRVLVWWQKMLFLNKLNLKHSEICEPSPVFPAPQWKQQAANATDRKSMHPVLLKLF